MTNIFTTLQRAALTRTLSTAWALVDAGERLVRFAERVEGARTEHLRTRIAWRLMTLGEDIGAHGLALEYAVDRWARALRVPMADVLRQLVPQPRV